MKQEILRQLDGYEELAKEAEIGRKYGMDYTLLKGQVAKDVERYHPSRITLRVADIVEETCSTKTLRLVSPEGYLPPFQAGQYIALFLEFGNVRTSRAYSISSPPHRTGYYEITVRRVPDGLVSNHLHDEVKVGDTLVSSGPAGCFCHNPVFHDNEMVCLAGGCGIGPIMSMIREVVECGLDRTIHLFYGNQAADDIIFHDELVQIASRHGNVNYIPVIEEGDGISESTCSSRSGLITGSLIQKELGGITGKTFYLCGPSAMYDFCCPQLEELGVPGRKIRRELYGAPRNISACPGWPEEVAEDATFQVAVNGGEPIPAVAGESLLVALERGGFTVRSLCRSGECSLCRVKVVSGNVFQPDGALLRVSDRKYGYVHSCAAYPLEDLEVSL